MAEISNVVAWENGQLRFLHSSDLSREVVLALPLSQLLVKIVRVPEGSFSAPGDHLLPLLQAMNPYPDEALTVTYETLRETASELVVLAAAAPESALEEVGEALDAEKKRVTRIDALAIGALRNLWGQLLSAGKPDDRRLVLLGGDDCYSAFVLDGDLPVAVRAISPGDNLRREVMLLLLEAEDFAGARPLAECVCVGAVESAALAFFAPVRQLEIGEDVPLLGVADRTAEPATLNALPGSWREILDEARFKQKWFKGFGVVAGLWALVMLVLFGVPVVYGFMEDYQKGLSKEQARPYRAVREMKEKTELVRKYSDHSRGSLEIMKALSDRLPQGITLLSWNFKRGESVKVTGEADSPDLVYQFKDAMATLSLVAEDEEEEDLSSRLFPTVILTGPSARGAKQRFDLECRLAADEEASE